jgi:hypothetical protein
MIAYLYWGRFQISYVRYNNVRMQEDDCMILKYNILMLKMITRHWYINAQIFFNYYKFYHCFIVVFILNCCPSIFWINASIIIIIKFVIYLFIILLTIFCQVEIHYYYCHKFVVQMIPGHNG